MALVAPLETDNSTLAERRIALLVKYHIAQIIVLNVFYFCFIETLRRRFILGDGRRLEGAGLAFTFEFLGYALKIRLSSGLEVPRKVICSCDAGG